MGFVVTMRPYRVPSWMKAGPFRIASRSPWLPTLVMLCVTALGSQPELRAAEPPRPAMFHPVWNSGPESRPDAVLLLAEFNCLACHPPTLDNAPSWFRLPGPDLSAVASRVTPQFLRAFLAQPHEEKPGTAMPDLLHGLNPQAKRESVDDLVHFLCSLGERLAGESTGGNPFKMAEGKVLYHQVGCVACHAPRESDAPAPLEDRSIPLGNLAKKYTVPALARFLVDPLAVRPSGRMPSMNLTEAEALSIAMYLLRDQTNNPSMPPARKVQGLFYEYFEHRIAQVAGMEDLKPIDSGTVENFSLTPKRRDNDIGFRYTGLVRIPREGTYTFHTSSDDGSVLFVGGRKVVDNDGEHGTVERSGSIALTGGDHPIMLLWSNLGGGAELRVTYEGPGLAKQIIPDSVLSYLGQPMEPLEPELFTLDPAKVARGRQYFAVLGCVACHETGLTGLQSSRPVSPPALAQLRNPMSGCLSDSVAAGQPLFPLSPIQREMLRGLLRNPERITAPVESSDQAERTLTALNCFACHHRESQGGPTSDRAEFFQMRTEEDLGDEGRIPPHLTRVGAKLRPDWLREVLGGRGRVRPYMATRMPRFAEGHVGALADLLAQADEADNVPEDEPVAMADVKYGRALVGSGGLSCIACHVFGSYPSLGIQAMDLTQMSKRLRQDWFRRYLQDPPSLRPGTRMPSFWPEGKSMREDILNGDTSRQLDAIWAYLNRSSDVGVPPGLIQGSLELSAADHAILYRAFIHQSGTRGIGVAYPEKANLTFDANELRLALIWQGPFIDAAKHRSGRGAGFEGPLGYNVLEMPTGPSLAVLPNLDADWPTATGRDAGYLMRGYQLDERRRPTFQYDFQGIRIEDYPVAVAGELESFLRRTMTFHAARPVANLWFRAWRGDRIEARSALSYLADGRVELNFEAPPGTRPVVRNQQGKMELLIPVITNGGALRLVQEIIW